ncbi:putative UDP-Glycosyltransferase/glycogen phosphorylase [Vibrio cholerae]|uniref:glycosyltransferase n=1 Tax=Vibrio cholerae TaxID=666 RepID=UPI0011DADFEE|nr:glycosyltransferase [Vibrio cholerae]EIJ2221252.1 glycosyltransferase [Vibrio cholerae]EJL6998737.1 glycosyltransferase [Vibrio cholerae]TXZ84843.1 glycosyltransferase [Vibrio cholerae]TYA91142.1 glycosyltransferase [Vibrio cholerae]BCN19297.1 putative glycosyltransferase [Vibrio cholerae]
MKKILFFVGEFPSLSETFVLNQIVYMMKSGYDVKVLSVRRDKETILHDNIKKDDIVKNSHYLFDKYEWSNKSAIFARALISSITKPKTIKSIIDYGALAFCSINRFCLVKDEMENFKPDVIISHFGPTGVIAQSIIEVTNEFENTKHIVFFHGYEMSEYKTFRRYLSKYKRMAEMGAIFIPISYYWMEKLTSNIAFVNSQVIRMGVDINLFPFVDKPFISDNKIKIFSACRFVEKKGIEYAIKACALLNIDFIYEIAGSGPLGNDLDELILSLDLQEKVRLIGPLKSHEVAERIAVSDIYLLPSITAKNGDMEGIPVALMEAMSSGVVCLSTYHSGIPELIDDAVSGFLVPEKDEYALSSKILQISKMSQEEISSIRYNAREKVVNEFNLSIELDKLCTLL